MTDEIVKHRNMGPTTTLVGKPLPGLVFGPRALRDQALAQRRGAAEIIRLLGPFRFGDAVQLQADGHRQRCGL